jgi:hypothetical protein
LKDDNGAQKKKSDLLECIVCKILKAKNIQNIDSAARTLREKATVDARNQPLEHL